MQVIKSNNAIFGINREYIAIMLVAEGSILSTTGYIYANEGKYHPFTTVTVRGLVALVITYLISLRQKQDLTYSDAENFKWNLLSSFIFLITTYIYAWCQFYLPLPIAITLQATSPIFVALYDKFLNGVELNKAQTFWLTVTFIGALLTANGNQISAFFFSKSTQSSSTFGNYLSDDPMVVLWVSIVLLLVMVLYSYGLILIKKLKNCSSL